MSYRFIFISLVFLSLIAACTDILPAINQSAHDSGAASPSPVPTASSAYTPTVSIPTSYVSSVNKYSIVRLQPAPTPATVWDFSYPDLWTYIDPDRITLYPYNHFTDYLYAPNGDLWLIGGFGVVRQQPNGAQTWFSIQNGLPVNYFQAIAVAPNGDIWVGGVDNALFRFDGAEWHDEGQFLPAPQANRFWLCLSSTIFGIDFDQNGQIWVANGGLNLYTRQEGRWLDFGFPKDLLPTAGGGGCPLGLHVSTPDHITIVRSGCCAMPDVAYHYDGRAWTDDLDVSEFTTHVAMRRREGQSPQYKAGRIDTAGFPWPFPSERILPADLHPRWYERSLSPWPPRFGGYALALDDEGVLWINNGERLFHNRFGHFRDAGILLNGALFDPDFDRARWLDFLADPVVSDGPTRFIQASRWFFGRTELGAQEGPHLSYGMLWNYPWLYFSRDSAGRIWLYLPGHGLVMADGSRLTVFPGPADLTLPLLGGVKPMADGRVLIGTAGGVWIFDHGTWEKWVLPDTNEIVWLFDQDSQGVLYAATDTAVYRITKDTYSRMTFVEQDAKPVVRPHDPKNPAVYHKRYIEAGTHSEMLNKTEGPLHYYALLLRVLPDDTVLYANSHLLAQFDGRLWRSFLFEQIRFDAVAVDNMGNLWAYAGYNGLLKFEANIFQDYRALSRP